MAGELEAGWSSETRGAEQAIAALKKGARLLKCGKRGKPKFCTFRLSCDEKLLIWYSKEREKCLSLSTATSVVLGQKTTNLLRLHWPEKEPHSLSVIYKNGECSLDLICKDKDQAECWHLGLTALVSALYSPLLLVDSTSSRRINSCTNSPPSYIQQRSRLFSVHDTRKFTQVHSLYGSPRLIQTKVSKSGLDCSEAFVSPRQRTWSDLDFYLERITPEMVNRVKNSFMDIPVADKTQVGITQMPKLKPSEGSHVAYGIDSLKDIFVWGEVPGSVLENGDASQANVSLPRLLMSTQILDVQNVTCGEKYAAVVTKQGEVFSWGKESSGISEPKIIESLASIPMKAIAFGAKHTCALAISGELYEWGEGTHSLSLCGDRCQGSQWFPHKLFDPLDGISVLKIACGQWHTAIISSSGQLFTFGDGTFGVLGHGDTMSIARPKEVESLKGLRSKAVACGPWHTAAIVEILGTVKSNAPSGKLFTWGDADRGKLGHADKKSKLVPTCVKPLTDTDFAQVCCAKALTVALTITGVVFIIGNTGQGKLGNYQLSDTSICSVEGPLKTEFVREISSGSSHVAVLTMNGKVYTWGKGTEGQLGLGDNIDRSSPTLVESLEDKQVDSIACGSNFTVAVCLHRSISDKDQSVCSSCRLSFTFTRKKHNCYNCGSMFCNSCSTNKASRAALGPDRSKRYRVCDVCFTQLQKIEEHGTLSSRLAIHKEEVFPTEIRAYTPKLSRIFKEANSMMEKLSMAQGSNQRNQDLAVPGQVRTQRWGQVECPSQFKCAQNSIACYSTSNKQTVDVSPTQRMPGVPPKGASSLPQAATNLKAELDSMENILLGEVKQLQAQVTTLAEQCRHRSLKVQVYKRKVEETWLIIRHEAAKCKAAKEIIKVLTNQKNTLSEKILAREQSYNSVTIPSRITEGQPVKAELPDPPDKNPVTGKFQQLSSIRDHHQQVDRECIQSSIAAVANGPITHQNGRRTASNSNYAVETDATIPPVDPNGVIEQIERGVYITVVTSPSGNKGVKRIRFSRKHFGEKEAQKWWEANESKVFAKYSSKEQVTE